MICIYCGGPGGSIGVCHNCHEELINSVNHYQESIIGRKFEDDKIRALTENFLSDLKTRGQISGFEIKNISINSDGMMNCDILLNLPQPLIDVTFEVAERPSLVSRLMAQALRPWRWIASMARQRKGQQP